jgi:hypothetical protein
MYSEYGCNRFLRNILFVLDCTAPRYRGQYFAEVISDKFVTGVLPSAKSNAVSMWLVFQILSFPCFVLLSLQTRMDCTVAVMRTRKCACGLDRIGFFLHCFEFSQFRKNVRGIFRLPGLQEYLVKKRVKT